MVLASVSPAGELFAPSDMSAPAVFGVREGIVVAVHPAALDARPEGGPRGLIRVGVEIDGVRHLVNYLAIEPVIGGHRGLSELERGGDGLPGKRFALRRPSDAPVTKGEASTPWVFEDTPDGRSLRFDVVCEPFDNGARPRLEIALFEKRPLAMRLRSFCEPGGAVPEALVITATMGNQSRCRELWLGDGVVSARELYAAYRGDGFTEREPYPVSRLRRTPEGDAVVAIAPDEIEPRETWPLSNGGWRCTTPWLVQYWLKPRAAISEALRCRVNGRRVYWAGRVPIPCGASFENFELIEPFRQGAESWFGVAFVDGLEAIGFAKPQSPRWAARRSIPDDEAAPLAEARRETAPLRNGDFRDGLAHWVPGAGGSAFRRFERDGQWGLTTFGAGGDADTGRLFQCFVVPPDATRLRLHVHGGADPAAACVSLWRGESLWRWTSGRNDNAPFRVEWDVRPLRGEAVTLEIRDSAKGPWGFVGVQGIELVSEVAAVPRK